ncbi:hypothetical protein FRAAL6440 [Frankia alni ACN14a]|uniref:Uncharacterized protein n=1 Tax=Frankia alni (strain DSM 45986 / CECT 9034 / ACN14a) TaxID=326424 RepID=Q0RBW7_FRAAA|nr:hypothetical protein FRAAL6440 [Frankia alni ACN14a]
MWACHPARPHRHRGGAPWEGYSAHRVPGAIPNGARESVDIHVLMLTNPRWTTRAGHPSR